MFSKQKRPPRFFLKFKISYALINGDVVDDEITTLDFEDASQPLPFIRFFSKDHDKIIPQAYLKPEYMTDQISAHFANVNEEVARDLLDSCKLIAERAAEKLEEVIFLSPVSVNIYASELALCFCKLFTFVDETVVDSVLMTISLHEFNTNKTFSFKDLFPDLKLFGNSLTSNSKTYTTAEISPDLPQWKIQDVLVIQTLFNYFYSSQQFYICNDVFTAARLEQVRDEMRGVRLMHEEPVLDIISKYAK